MSETLSGRPDLQILPVEILSWIETKLGHPEMAIVGRVMAIRIDYDSDLQRGIPKPDWISEKKAPLHSLLSKKGYQLLGGVALPTRQLEQLRHLTDRPGGYFCLYLLPNEQTGQSLTRKLGGHVSRNERTLIVSLAPPIVPLWSWKQFMEDLAGWGNEAVKRFGSENIQLDKQQDPFNIALQDIVLTVAG